MGLALRSPLSKVPIRGQRSAGALDAGLVAPEPARRVCGHAVLLTIWTDSDGEGTQIEYTRFFILSSEYKRVRTVLVGNVGIVPDSLIRDRRYFPGYQPYYSVVRGGLPGLVAHDFRRRILRPVGGHSIVKLVRSIPKSSSEEHPVIPDGMMHAKEKSVVVWNCLGWPIRNYLFISHKRIHTEGASNESFPLIWISCLPSSP